MFRIIVAFFLFLICFICNAKPVLTVLGMVEEDNPLILELIESQPVLRLQAIDQSGPDAYFTPGFPKFTRYEHSLGVYALLKQFGAAEAEQIAGLMHDTSHTVFSHLGDIVFQAGDQRVESYQDDIHNWFLAKMKVDTILAKHGLTLQDVSPKNPNFMALDSAYPDMNADRIEYNLHTGLLFNDLSEADIKQILSDLVFQEKWYFTNVTSAKKLAKLSTYYTRTFWGSARNVAMYSAGSALLRYALEHQVVTTDELHFGTDQEIIQKLKLANKPIINRLITIMESIDDYFIVTDKNQYDVYQPVKMRGFDPLVKLNDTEYRLTELSKDFEVEYHLAKEHCHQGIYIKFQKIDESDILSLLVQNT